VRSKGQSIDSVFYLDTAFLEAAFFLGERFFFGALAFLGLLVFFGRAALGFLGDDFLAPFFETRFFFFGASPLAAAAPSPEAAATAVAFLGFLAFFGSGFLGAFGFFWPLGRPSCPQSGKSPRRLGPSIVSGCRLWPFASGPFSDARSRTQGRVRR